MGFFKKLLKKQLKHLLKPFKLLKKWLIPKQKTPDKGPVEIGQRYGSAQSLGIVYGVETIPGVVVDQNVTDSPGGVKNDTYHVLLAFCAGEIQQVYEVFFDGVLSTNSRFAGKFTADFRLGGATQTTFPEAIGNLNRYHPTTSNYPGIVVGYFTFLQDEAQSAWTAAPEITIKVLGRNCYDPRYNGPRPGTIYANPAICLLDYMKDPIWGAGLKDEDINLPYIIREADAADVMQQVNTRGIVCSIQESGNYVCEDGEWTPLTVPRFTLNIVIDTQKSCFDNMVTIANTFRGYWPSPDGRIAVAGEREGNPVFHLDENNLVSATLSEADINERWNRVVVEFTDTRLVRTEREVCYPPLGDPIYNAWLLEDNLIPLETTLKVEGIANPHEALQLAEIAAKGSRQAKQISCVGFPECQELDIGDIVSFSWADFGYALKEFRVVRIRYLETGEVEMDLAQHEDGIYPWSETNYEDIQGGSYLGDPNNPATPTNLSVTPDATFATIGNLSWSYPSNNFVRRFSIIYYHKIPTTSGTEPFVFVEKLRTETVGKDTSVPLFNIEGVDPEVGYLLEIQVRAISTTNKTSDAAKLVLTLNYPVAPQSLNLTASNYELTCAPSLASTEIEPLGTVFNVELLTTGQQIKATRNVTFTGLRHNTEYAVRAQTVNAFGASAWKTEEITTTANTTDLIDLIGGPIKESVFEQIIPELQGLIGSIAEGYDTRNLIVEGVVDAFKDLDTEQKVIQETITRRETDREITASLTQLTADFSDEQGIRTAQYTELTTAIATETEARVTQLELLEATVDENTATIGTTQTALANEVLTRTTQVNTLSSNFNTLDGEVSATVLRVDQAEANINGNASAIAGIRVAVAGTNSQSQAELILSTTVSNANTAVARAYLGVTSTAGGVTRVNGIVVDGATNRLEFRGDAVLFTNTAGTPAIYLDTVKNRYAFNGDIVASTITGSTLQTAETGIRTLLSPAYPIWYGTGTPGVTTAYFSCSASGQILITKSCFIRMDTVTRLQSDPSNWFLQCGNNDTVEMNTNFKIRTSTDPFWPFGLDVDGVTNFMYGTNYGLSTIGGNYGMRAVGTAIGIEAVGTSGIGVRGEGSTWDFYANGAGANYGPFTGAHEALIEKEVQATFGMIVCDKTLITTAGLSSTITEVELSNRAEQKSVSGAIIQRFNLTTDNKPAALKLLSDIEYEALISNYDLIQFNALGEGMLLVCGQNGNIEAGDYITTSSREGIAMKQSDDIMRNYTIAKARQSVDFLDNEPRMIAVFYYAG
jgi:hypothetical protein